MGVRICNYLAIFIWTAIFVSPAAAARDSRPNFLFILTDDQRWDCMSCAGHPYLETPNMDRLAEEGARLSNAFVTTSLCSPSRASFLTGQYARVHGVTNNNYEINFEKHPTFPEYLQKDGYDTCYVGKWHMGWNDRWRLGYNTWISYPGQGVYFDQEFTYNDTKIKTIGHNTDVTTSFAVSWLKQKRDKPFMMYLGYKAPHQPWTPAERHQGMYKGKSWKPNTPPSFWSPLEGKPEYVRKHAGGTLRTPPEKRQPGLDKFVQQFSECIKTVDENLGRVWKALEQTGQMDNTVIIFAGDNGYFFREHLLGDKRAMYEPSMRIPMLIRYPKLIKPGTVVDELVLNIDVAPTILKLAGLKVPQAMQGRSMDMLLQGKENHWREAFLYEYLHEDPYMYPTVYGVRTKEWAYMHYPDLQDQDELYDMVNDPHQIKNVIKDSRYADDRARMKKLLAELEKEVGERAPDNTVSDHGEWRKGKSLTVPDR